VDLLYRKISNEIYLFHLHGAAPNTPNIIWGRKWKHLWRWNSPNLPTYYHYGGLGWIGGLRKRKDSVCQPHFITAYHCISLHTTNWWHLWILEIRKKSCLWRPTMASMAISHQDAASKIISASTIRAWHIILSPYY
jgi:hypothetical protein